MDIANYRPTALLPALSKIYEQAMSNQILNYVVFGRFHLFYPSLCVLKSPADYDLYAAIHFPYPKI